MVLHKAFDRTYSGGATEGRHLALFTALDATTKFMIIIVIKFLIIFITLIAIFFDIVRITHISMNK
jgi:hypothetical protein